MMILTLSLGIMILLTIFSVVGGNALTSVITSIYGRERLDITTRDVVQDVNYFNFNIDPFTAGIAILITIIAIATVTGISILGSGLSGESVKVILICSSYIGLWTLLSLLAKPLIDSILYFGGLIYIILTVMYVIGVIQNFTQ